MWRSNRQPSAIAQQEKESVMMLHQCRLRQGSARTVAWIEARGARAGARVEIPELGGFWQVETVCPLPMTVERWREKQRIDRKGMPDI